MGSLVSRVQRTIETHGLLRAGERVGVAVSGGADSVALLLLLVELRERLGVVLSAVHFNHGLRGKASDVDEKFVAKLAAKHGTTLHTGHADVAGKAKRDKANLEDTARRARYEFFAEQIKEERLDKIAVAHTTDDQAETVLAHILRGTGLAGLGGIHPVAGHVVRPLLGVRRAELRVYLRSRKQTWREDASNRDVTKMRARIRKKLMPILEKQFQPAVVQHLATLAELARGDEAFLDALVKERAKTCVEKTLGSATIRACDLLGLGRTRQLTTRNTDGAEDEKDFAVSGRLVRRIAKEVKPRAGELGAEHVRTILQLAARGQNGKRLELPGLWVRREHDLLIFSPTENKTAKGANARQFERTITLDGKQNDIRVPELSCVFRFKVIDWPAKRGETTKRESVLDRDALRFPWCCETGARETDSSLWVTAMPTS